MAGGADTPPPPRRAGRPYDHSGDADVLAVTLDALADQDYERVTLDAVARRTGRAKTTLYRRWPTKLDLALAAVRSVGPPPELDRPPDTGSVRGDLIALVDSPWLGGPERRPTLVAGLLAAGRSSALLADTVRSSVVDPYVRVHEEALRRGVDRGELGRSVASRIPRLASVVPAMSCLGLAGSGAGSGRALLVSVVDEVLLPSLCLPGPCAQD